VKLKRRERTWTFESQNVKSHVQEHVPPVVSQVVLVNVERKLNVER
jgi:hypothetical protein